MRHIFTISLSSALIGALCGAVIATVLGGERRSAEEFDAAVNEAVNQAVDEAMQEARAELTASVERTMSAQDSRIAEVYQQVAASVVVIDAEGPERINEEGVAVIPAALATGFVLDEQGHIATAAHVLVDKTSFVVIFPNGDRHSARPIGDDIPFSDVAVLRIDEPDAVAELIVPSFGSASSIATGETVLAIGNTLLGQEIALTVGVVSDPDTEFFRERYEQDNLIQTDAALNHGNSGGILANLDGEIVGMTAVIARTTREGEFVDGVGFAVQIDAVLEVARAIAAQGYYPRPSFGVVDERLLTPTAARQLDLEVSEGSFLIELQRAGAFARAGVRPGDVLRALDGIQINAESPYLNVLATLEPNVPVNVQIHRGGEEYRLRITPDLRAP